MEKHLFIACFMMFLLSLAVLATMFTRRMRDVRLGKTDPRYFKTYDLDTRIPAPTVQAVRNYINLFESPVLFYAVIGLVLAMGLAHSHLVVLAYTYVAIRVVHSVVHLTRNKLLPRMITFGLSMLVLLLIWTRTLLLVLG